MKTRIIGPDGSCYHIFSRVIERRFYLGDTEKEVFRDMMWRAADFSGVNIITYCILDNHFHILVEVPEQEEVNDDELYRRLKVLYGRSRPCSWNDPLGEFERSVDDPVWRAKLRKKYLRRMYDLSEFMRTLKLRFSFWFNRKHKRSGGLWDGRFGSVIVEDCRFGKNRGTGIGNISLITVAAYIDLNAVRAGIVEDPVCYRWCGFAEVNAGVSRIRCGFSYMYGCHQTQTSHWKNALATYRSVLLEKRGAQETKGTAMLLQRVRYFTAGAILGSKDFVNHVFLENRSFFGPRRQTGARRMRNEDWKGLFVARQVG